MRYLGPNSNKFAAYSVASVAGTALVVCSCSLLAMFAGIYKLGAGLGPASAFLYSGPVLLALLSIMPLKGAALGAILLVAYSLGHCGLVLAGGTSIGLVQRLADSRGWNRAADMLRKFAGALILIVGVYILLA